jgi:hypothetical protein
MLPVGVIVVDLSIQQRVSMDAEKVEEYAALYADGYDLGRLVVFQVDEQWILADGFHRVDAARRAGLAELPCAVYHGTMRDAIFYATSCNLHGKPLSNLDKRKRVQTLLTDPEWAQWSDNSIARHCGVANSFVGKIRHELSLHSERSDDGMDASPHSEIRENGTSSTRRTYRNRYGQERTMNTSAIGHQPRPEMLELEPEAPEVDETTAPAIQMEALAPECPAPAPTQPEVQDPAPPEAATPRQDFRALVDALCDAWNGGDWDTMQTLMDALKDHEGLKTLYWTDRWHGLLFYKITSLYWQAMADASLAAIETVVARLSALDTYEEGEAEQQKYVAWLRDEGVTDPAPWETDPAWFANPDISWFVLDTLESTPHYRATLREQDQGEPAQLSLAEARPAPAPEEALPAPPAPDCPPFDTTIYVLGKLCKAGHEWGSTGKSRLRIKGRYCPDCNSGLKRQKRKEQQQAVGTGA